MKLTLPVPVEKVPVGPFSTTFRHESRLVDVIAVSRTSAGYGRWHYTAHYKHPDTHPDYPRSGVEGSLIHWIRRASHPAWKPPVFSNDKSGTVMLRQEGSSA